MPNEPGILTKEQLDFIEHNDSKNLSVNDLEVAI